MTEPSAADRKRACEIVCDWRGDEHMPTVADQALVSAIAAALHAHAESVRAELGHWSADAARRYAETRVEHERERCAKTIPTNWMDPMLSGTRASLQGNGPWGCPDIERLLRAIVAAIRAGAGGERRAAEHGQSPWARLLVAESLAGALRDAARRTEFFRVAPQHHEAAAINRTVDWIVTAMLDQAESQGI